jgi:hypothetical protein
MSCDRISALHSSATRTMPGRPSICALNLSAVVMMFDHSYAAITNSMPQLVALCKKAMKTT